MDPETVAAQLDVALDSAATSFRGWCLGALTRMSVRSCQGLAQDCLCSRPSTVTPTSRLPAPPQSCSGPSLTSTAAPTCLGVQPAVPSVASPPPSPPGSTWPLVPTSRTCLCLEPDPWPPGGFPLRQPFLPRSCSAPHAAQFHFLPGVCPSEITVFISGLASGSSPCT